MSLYSKFVKHISFPLIAKKDGLSKLIQDLKLLEKSQFWPRSRINVFQLERLRFLLIHAYDNTQFYKRRFDEADFNPRKFQHISEIDRIPFLTKNQIRSHLQSMIARNYPKSRLRASATGGTTGVKMEFFLDKDCISPKEAALYRFERWAGWDIGDSMGLVWTAQQDYVGHWTAKAKMKNKLFGRQVVFPAAIMNEEMVSSYVDELVCKRPVMIRAFTSPLYEVAKYIIEYCVNLELKGVITTGEPLYDFQRSVISRAFNCGVFDSYRSREAGPLAQECEEHDSMHINAESLYMEIVPAEGLENPEPGMGEIVITDLLNYGMPLIRYKMGDMGILSDKLCACGRGLPLLKKIAGRSSDMLYTPDKKQITAGSLVLYLVDEAPGLTGQMQIIQDKLNHLIIRATSDPAPTTEIIEYQKRTVESLFGKKMKVSFETVSTIPREKSGKYMFTKCMLTEDDLL